MRFSISLLFVLMAICLAAVSAIQAAEEPVFEDCICTREFEPVCGTDAQTYNNKCELVCAQKTKRMPNLAVVHEGAC